MQANTEEDLDDHAVLDKVSKFERGSAVDTDNVAL